MATIPIEIILQDAETPVDPTPTPEETNIVVPDTGAGTVGSGGTLAGSSAASIILPVILLVVALATVCTLLIHKHRKHQNSDKLSKKEKLLAATSTTIAVLSTTVLVGNLVIPATKAATSVEPGTAELETEDKITIVATREADNDSDTITATVKDTSYATANLDFGYKVTASMAKGTTTANLYLDGNADSPYYIAPVSDGTLTDNTWGYTLSEPTEESSYLSIPLSTKPTNIVKEIAKTAEDKPVDIYYTVQIDKDMPNGTYTGELEYTIAPAIEYMQDFSTLTPAEKTATLARMTEGKQYILKDNRDGNPYYISRLKDNNVWMTQNLDLDIDENTTYTHADTDLGWSDPAHPDLTASWKPINSTLTVEGTSVPGWTNSNSAPYSANPGDIYYYTSGTTENDTQYNSLAECEAAGHTDCQHYHAGNYYNWSAAVAGNDTSNLTEDFDSAPNSICPAGWRLPNVVGSNNSTIGSEWGTLLVAEDILVNPIGGGYATDGFRNIRKAPLFLVRSGVVNSGSLRYASNNGGCWSSTAHYGYDAYYLSFNNTDSDPANNDGRRSGYSVRCLAR